MKFVHNKKFLCSHLLYGILLICTIFSSKPASAFYEWQEKQSQIEAKGLLRGYGIALQYPDNDLLYPNRSSSDIAGIARLMVDAAKNNKLSFEFNAYQTFIPDEIQSAQNNFGTPTSTERSAALEKSFSNNDYVHLAIDRLAMRWSDKKINLTVGRQAINLATTFYFTPNDFFAPYAAQTFYRVYKPGVDAFRLEYGLSELSQLSYIGVLGYQEDINSDTGWSDSPDSSRSSNLIRWLDVFDNFEATLILGEVVDKNIIGAALQGELFDGIGLRIEGHYANPQESDTNDYNQLSIGFEHQWESNSELRLELYYNGLGGGDVSQYQFVQNSSNVQYLARQYTALGGSYEITPLFIGQAVIISNLTDKSHLLSFNTVYSLSDESEISINLSLPVGKEPAGIELKSEFGAYPKYFNVEFRSYF